MRSRDELGEMHPKRKEGDIRSLKPTRGLKEAGTRGPLERCTEAKHRRIDTAKMEFNFEFPIRRSNVGMRRRKAGSKAEVGKEENHKAAAKFVSIGRVCVCCSGSAATGTATTHGFFRFSTSESLGPTPSPSLLPHRRQALVILVRAVGL